MMSEVVPGSRKFKRCVRTSGKVLQGFGKYVDPWELSQGLLKVNATTGSGAKSVLTRRNYGHIVEVLEVNSLL